MCFGMLGNKVGMTQIFDKNGEVIPVTIIKVGPCFITQIKKEEQEGYNAIQIGYSKLKIKAKQNTKPFREHFIKNGINPLKYLKEYKISDPENYNIGQKLTVDSFNINSFVDVSGYTIGKGFAGNQKRHNFKRGFMTHGSKNHRAPGSIGAATYPGRVFPGKRMAGHLGFVKQTIKNLKIVDIDPNDNLLVLKGSVPGKIGNLLSIKYSK